MSRQRSLGVFQHSTLSWAMVAFLWLTTLTSCGQAIEPSTPVLVRIAGSTSMRGLVDLLATAYTAMHPHTTFDIQMAGADLGLESLRAAQADIAASSWPPTQEELARIDQDLRTTIVAWDGMSIIVHPTNPVTNLSVSQLRGLFCGRIGDWREIGGRVGDVLVVSREDGSGDRKCFEALVMDREPVTPAAVIMPSAQDVVAYVAKHPNAIGYTSMGELTSTVKALAIEGIEPTPPNVASGAYPLVRPLAFITLTQPPPEVHAFLEWVASPGAQALFKDLYASGR